MEKYEVKQDDKGQYLESVSEYQGKGLAVRVSCKMYLPFETNFWHLYHRVDGNRQDFIRAACNNWWQPVELDRVMEYQKRIGRQKKWRMATEKEWLEVL